MEQTYIAEQSDLMIFLDETGHELFSDPNYPLFGLGGCLMRASEYFSSVKPTWLSLKSAFFGGEQACLHASDLKEIDGEAIEAIGKFFRETVFSRIAVALTHLTFREQDWDPYLLAASNLQHRFAAVASRYSPSKIVVIVEQSSRGDALARRYLDYFPSWKTATGEGVPVVHRFMPKHTREAGLEVADFIMHAAGGQTRSRLSGSQRLRADYKAIFEDVDPSLASFLEISRVELSVKTPNPGPQPDVTAGAVPHG